MRADELNVDEEYWVANFLPHMDSDNTPLPYAFTRRFLHRSRGCKNIQDIFTFLDNKDRAHVEYEIGLLRYYRTEIEAFTALAGELDFLLVGLWARIDALHEETQLPSQPKINSRSANGNNR